MNKKLGTFLAGTALVGGVFGVGACTAESDPQPLKEAHQQDEQQAPARNQPGITADKAEGDLKVKTVAIGDAYGIGESLPYADVAVTNSSDTAKTYEYEIEVTDMNGDRIDTLYGTVDNVRPGQTVDTGDGDGEEDPMSMLTEDVPAEQVKYDVTYVDRY